MKKLILWLPLMVVLMASAEAQTKKVKEKDLKGVWKLVIDLENDEVKEELDDADVWERIFVKSVLGFVDDVLDEIDIRFEFESGNRLKVTVNALDEQETEYGTWKINKKGELILEGDEIDSDHDYWLFSGDILVAFDRGSDEPERNVYLVKMD